MPRLAKPVHVETIQPACRYPWAQLTQACTIAQALNRGKLVLAEPPREAR
jgi:hypothetical protein